jgi:hypothetical protein
LWRLRDRVHTATTRASVVPDVLRLVAHRLEREAHREAAGLDAPLTDLLLASSSWARRVRPRFGGAFFVPAIRASLNARR